jgi:hypothetical protein
MGGEEGDGAAWGEVGGVERRRLAGWGEGGGAEGGGERVSLSLPGSKEGPQRLPEGGGFGLSQLPAIPHRRDRLAAVTRALREMECAQVRRASETASSAPGP